MDRCQQPALHDFLIHVGKLGQSLHQGRLGLCITMKEMRTSYIAQQTVDSNGQQNQVALTCSLMDAGLLCGGTLRTCVDDLTGNTTMDIRT